MCKKLAILNKINRRNKVILKEEEKMPYFN
jgi:hypothetical protein